MSSAATARPLPMSRSFASRLGPPSLVDGAIAITALVGSLVLSSRHVSALRPGPDALDWASAGLIAGSTLPLVAWRQSPRMVFALTTAVSVLLSGLGFSIGVLVGPTAALYLWAASRDSSHPWARRDSELVIALFAAYLGASALGDRGFPGIELLHTGLAFAVGWFAGERTRLRREHIADLEERATRADREVERERRLALAEERARIGRDLHDSVGHAINVIVVRAGAARLRHDREPDRSYAALEAIEEIARQTAGEIDQIVGTLRDPGEENGVTTAPLGLASVPMLVAHHAASGLDVTVTTVGTPGVLEPAVDLAAYRILQEALTNAARHGTGRATVELAFHIRALEVIIVNPTREPDPPLPSNGGHGLIGMRERATLLGGTVDAARTNGTFRLHVFLPYERERA
jgi:signal transduction histidine kinase